MECITDKSNIMTTIQIDKKTGVLLGIVFVVGLIVGGAVAVICGSHQREFERGMMGFPANRVQLERQGQAGANGEEQGSGWMMRGYQNAQGAQNASSSAQ